MRRAKYLLRELAALGPADWLALRRTKKQIRTGPKGHFVPIRCEVPGLHVRAGTSDMLVFSDIYFKKEYRCLDHVRNAELIIDCGANVGYSSAYFAHRHPRARVIAVEPDPSNYAACAKNLARFSDRCTIIRSGIWSKPIGLVFGEGMNGDPSEWAITVREARCGESAAMQAVDINTLLEDSGFDRISILKIDIEGSESAVFRENTDWLRKVDHMVVEIHEGPPHDRDRHRNAVMSAVEPLNPRVAECEELTVFDFVSKPWVN